MAAILAEKSAKSQSHH